MKLALLRCVAVAASAAVFSGTGKSACCVPYISGYATALGGGQVQVTWMDGTPGAADSPQVSIRREDGTSYHRTNTLPIPPEGNSVVLTGQPLGAHHYTVTEVLLGDDGPAVTSPWLVVTVT